MRLEYEELIWIGRGRNLCLAEERIENFEHCYLFHWGIWLQFLWLKLFFYIEMPNVWSILKDEYAASIKTTFIFAIHFLGISSHPIKTTYSRNARYPFQWRTEFGNRLIFRQAVQHHLLFGCQHILQLSFLDSAPFYVALVCKIPYLAAVC